MTNVYVIMHFKFRQCYPRTFTISDTHLSNGTIFLTYKMSLGNRRKGKLTVQSIVVILFLNEFANKFSLACKSGKRSARGQPVRLFPSKVTKIQINAKYVTSWPDLVNIAIEKFNWKDNPPVEEMGKDYFCKAWNQYLPNMKIMKSGSGICYVCTDLMNKMKVSTFDVMVAFRYDLRNHREKSKAKMEFYVIEVFKTMQEISHLGIQYM